MQERKFGMARLPSMSLDKRIANLTRIQNEIESTREKTLASTRLIVNLFAECEDAGVNTLTALQRQSGQLKRTEETLDGIHATLQKSEEIVIQMTNTEIADKSYCGLSCCAFPRNLKHKEKNEDLWISPPSTKVEDKKSKKAPKMTEKNDSQLSPSDVMNDNKKVQFAIAGKSTINKGTAIESEMEINSNLDDVSRVVSNMKKIALDLGHEVTTGNEQLDRLNEKAQSTNVRLSSLNNKSGKLLRMNTSWYTQMCGSCCNKEEVLSKLYVVSKSGA